MARSGKQRIFITHSWEEPDKLFARKLRDRLEAQGFEVWHDEKSLGPGFLSDGIGKGLAWCDVYIPILSCVSMTSPACKEEIHTALGLSIRRERGSRPLIIPVLIEHCESVIEEQFPQLISRHYIKFAEKTFEEAFNELMAHLGILLPGATTQTGNRGCIAQVSRSSKNITYLDC